MRVFYWAKHSNFLTDLPTLLHAGLTLGVEQRQHNYCRLEYNSER